jgi:hypothetical protein
LYILIANLRLLSRATLFIAISKIHKISTNNNEQRGIVV